MVQHAEFIECVKFHQWLKLRNIRHTHIANEGNGNAYRGSMNKKMGVSAGFPDYIVLVPVGKMGSLVPVAIEMKRPTGGRVSNEQTMWLAELKVAGFKTAVCKGCAEAVAFIKECGYKDSMPDFKRLAQPF